MINYMYPKTICITNNKLFRKLYIRHVTKKTALLNELICHETFHTKIKSSLYSRYYAEAHNQWRGPSPRLSAKATQHQRNVAALASGLINFQTSWNYSDVFHN